jgi:hypothetical protein
MVFAEVDAVELWTLLAYTHFVGSSLAVLLRRGRIFGLDIQGDSS